MSDETVVRSFVYVKKTKTEVNVCLTNNETVTIAQSSTRASSHIESVLTHFLFLSRFFYTTIQNDYETEMQIPPKELVLKLYLLLVVHSNGPEVGSIDGTSLDRVKYRVSDIGSQKERQRKQASECRD